MAVIVSLLRGVNMGAYNRMTMADLKAVYEALGLRDVRTLLQSGNVVFQTSARDLPALGRRIEKGIEERFGFRIRAVLRTTDQLRAAIQACPFAVQSDIDPAKLAVTFLEAEVMYNYFPEGFANTKFRLPAGGTTRNWNTTLKLLALAEEMESRTARPRA
jgi:uncharacterized protein (DUF1697 family)